MYGTDRFRFPSRYIPNIKFFKSFKTGDSIKVVIRFEKKVVEYVDRVAVSIDCGIRHLRKN